jgi:hypothetical protein
MNEQSLTVGNVTFGNGTSFGHGYWDAYGNWIWGDPITTVTPSLGWTYYYPHEPTHCIGKAHVFDCDHVAACKCGAVKRVMPREKNAAKKR